MNTDSIDNIDNTPPEIVPWENLINGLTAATWDHIGMGGTLGLCSAINLLTLASIRFTIDHPKTALHWINMIADFQDRMGLVGEDSLTEHDVAAAMYEYLAASYELPK